MRKFYTLKYDAVFKNIFLKDEELLKIFLTNIMRLFYDDFKIDFLGIKNGELTKKRLYIKNKTVDLLVKIGNKIINIELNTNYDETTKNRNLYYLLNSVVEGVHKNNNYHFVSDYIQLNFNFLGNNKKGIESYHFNEDKTKNRLTESIRVININVDYYYSKWYNQNNKEEIFNKYKDIIILDFSKEDLDSIKDSDKYMDRIKKY